MSEVIHPERDYFAFLAEGKFMLLKERASGRYMFYPRVAEPRSGSTDLEWVPASGGGTVYSTTVMRERAPKESYNVALIDLDEGPRMMSRVEGIASDAVKIGMKVTAKIIQEESSSVLVFEPA